MIKGQAAGTASDPVSATAAGAAVLSPPGLTEGTSTRSTTEPAAREACAHLAAAASEPAGGGGSKGREADALSDVPGAPVQGDNAHLAKSAYSVSDKMLARCGRAVDIVDPTSKQTCCFTKAYTKYGVGTGSVWCDTTCVYA